MIVKVITYIIGGILVTGFLWYAGKVIVAGIRAVDTPANKPRKKGKKQ